VARTSSSLLPQPILGVQPSRSSRRPKPDADEAVAGQMLPQPVLGVAPEGSAKRKAKPPESARQAGLQADRALVSGIGGFGFRSLSPPGSGRLVRIPFFPLNPSQAWTGASGIQNPGDDPVLDLVIPAGSMKSDRLTMLTYQFDYGAYKILGLQTNFQGSYNTGETTSQGPPPIPRPSVPGGVGISMGNLALYNGQTLMVQLEDMDASTFQLLPDYRSSLMFYGAATTGGQRENPYNYLARRSRFFPGLRDYPVVFGTANVTIQVQAFISQPMTVDTNIPFTCYVVADLVEDYVYGDPVNNSAPARAGANVKLGAKDLGISPAGRRQFDLQSARHPTKRT
jgi:hypothetical protein